MREIVTRGLWQQFKRVRYPEMDWEREGAEGHSRVIFAMARADYTPVICTCPKRRLARRLNVASV
jgi:hypothetical protein